MTTVATNRLARQFTTARHLASLIWKHADATDHSRRLSPEVIPTLIDTDLFRLYRYTISGASVNYRRNPLPRALREVHAMTQHFAAATPQCESVGSMLLGLLPLPPPLIRS